MSSAPGGPCGHGSNVVTRHWDQVPASVHCLYTIYWAEKISASSTRPPLPRNLVYSKFQIPHPLSIIFGFPAILTFLTTEVWVMVRNAGKCLYPVWLGPHKVVKHYANVTQFRLSYNQLSCRLCHEQLNIWLHAFKTIFSLNTICITIYWSDNMYFNTKKAECLQNMLRYE